MNLAACDTIKDVVSDEIVIEAGQVFDEAAATRVEALGYEKVRVRSGLTCETARGCCAPSWATSI